jgi:ribosomal protein L10
MGIRDDKAKVVAELEEKLKASQSTVFTDYRG